MIKFIITYWLVALLYFVPLFASIDVQDYENINSELKLIEEVFHLGELTPESALPGEPGTCQTHSDCLPGGLCTGKSENGKVCRCYPGVSGDNCKTVEECVKNPKKCGDGKDVECTYDPNNKIPYCKCKTNGQRFDVKLKKCVEQKSCESYEDCQNGAQCEGEVVKYCRCKPGTYGDFCETIEECENDPKFCGVGDGVECKYNFFLKRAFCHCLNGTQRYDVTQKKCVARKQCHSQEECRPYGACTKNCQSYEPCNDNGYFEGLESCHCVEGTSGERCEIVDDCYNKVVDCGSGGNVECKYGYVSGVTGYTYCNCTKNNQKFDKVSKLCKDCDCGLMATNCDFRKGKKVCTCNSLSYDIGDKCEDCKCGEGSDGCKFKEGKKQCICKPGFLVNHDVCEKCDCGENSTNCKFENGLKVCTCKPGFAMGNYSICTPICNNTHKCENGGRCLQNACVCLSGTTGPFCNIINACRNKLCGEADAYCKYDIKTESAYCECQNRGVVYDPFNKNCKVCSCDNTNGNQVGDSWAGCEFVKGKKICECNEGYAFDPKQEICKKCDCGSNSVCEIDSKGKKQCLCDEGYKENEGSCMKCDCGIHGTCRIENSRKVCACDQGYNESKGTCFKCDCGPNGRCVFSSSGNTLRCDCDPGFAEDSKKCKFCYCGPDSKCSYRNKKKVCECPKGYKDINGYCKDINECLKDTSCPKPGMLCINTPGSFRCDCKPGYLYRSPNEKNTTPWCEKQQEIKPDYSPWKIGYGVMSAGFIIIFAVLVIIIFKIRRNSTPTVRQPEIPLGRPPNYH